MPISRAAVRRPAPANGVARAGIPGAGDAASSILLRVTVSAKGRERLLAAVDAGPTSFVLTTLDGSVGVLALVDLGTARPTPEVHYGSLTVDWSRGAVSTAIGRAVLSPTELRLLGALLDGACAPMTCEELSRRVWPDTHTDARGCAALPVYVHALRRHLASIGAASILRTERGVGYRLDP